MEDNGETQAWAPSEVDGDWLEATVVQRREDGTVVLRTKETGAEHTCTAETLYLMNTLPEEGMDDMARLNYLHEPALLNNLRPCTDADNAGKDMNGAVCLQRNGLGDNHNGGGLETIGGMDLVHNLVMQSRDGVLRLFPWLSDDFRSASFRRLRALGGFVVSANYSMSSGVLPPIEIGFPDEDSRCQVEVPVGWRAAHACEGSREVALVLEPRAEGRVVSFAGRANLTYTLRPSACA